MAAHNPDFISRVEENRFAPTPKDVASPKRHARQQERKKAYWNENISLRLVPPPGEHVSSLSLRVEDKESSQPTGIWNIPRFRLTASFLRDTVNRGRGWPVVVSHLYDRNTKSVILPRDDMQVQCRAFPVVYDVIVNFAGGITRGGVLAGEGDSYYDGDILFHIENVPHLSISRLYEVTSHDLERWLVNGAISSVESIQIATDKVKSLRELLQKLEKDMKHIPNAPLFNEQGRAYVGEDLKAAREAKFIFLQEEKETNKVKLEKARQSLEAERAKHISACSLQITELHEDPSRKDGNTTLSFYVKLMGGKKKKDYYTSLITKKPDWNTALMLATGTEDRTATKSNQQRTGNEGHQKVVINEADEADHFVDVGTIKIVILPDGYGTHEAYIESEPLATGRCTHRLFHGYFTKGEYQNGTLHSDKGIYTGSFKSNEPSRGKMKYSDGVILDGAFAFPPETKHAGHSANHSEAGQKYVSPLGPNPYQRGLPHKYSRVHFKDGASYDGELCHGLVTGKGSSAPKENSEINGDFVNGTLQNNDGVEGQGGTNLLRSLLYNGERSWNL